MTKPLTEWLQTVFFKNNKLNNRLLFGNNSLNLKMGLLSADFYLLQKVLPPAIYETLAERFEAYETLIS